MSHFARSTSAVAVPPWVTRPTTADATTITVELPEAFDARWNRLPGITVDGTRITIDPAEYFFRFENNSWLVIDWQTVEEGLLAADETETSAVEQMALDFIKAHARSTSDAGEVLAVAWQVYSYLFRHEHLAALGLPEFTAGHLAMLRQAATLMALDEAAF